MVELIELIKQRRTVHNYSNQQVDLQILNEAIELCLLAPNHKHTKPWLFFRLGKEARQKIVDLALSLNKEKLKEEFTEVKAKMIEKKFSNCAEILVVGRKPNDNLQLAREDYASIAGGLQNMSLYLWQKGIGTKWSTGALTKHEQIYKLINKTKNEVELEGFFWVGYAEQIPRAPEKAQLDKVYFQTN